MREGVTIIMQARTSSMRFPGKVMIDFLGLPLAILAAKRAGSRDHRLVLATSVEDSDDALAITAARYGLNCVRGPLDDVLNRFVKVLQGCSNDEIVVRLTADNIVPDGDLIEEVVADFKARGVGFLTTIDPASGLPYGCGIEVTRAGLIRQAAREARTAFEREHVMPWIRARHPISVFTEHEGLGRGHYRCTIDCLDDYLSLIRSFPSDRDPVTISWQQLIASLEPGNDQPTTTRPIEKLVLGTAQFGMPYGIVRAHEPNENESTVMIKHAIASGVGWLDTARDYGNSEGVIGKVMSAGWTGRCRIVTKLSPMVDCAPEAAPNLAALNAENSLRSSCMALQSQSLDTVLLHRSAHLHMWERSVFDVLRRWQSESLLGTIGVSVQTPQELLEVLEIAEVGHIQMPFNILDHRWSLALERLVAVRCEREVKVHARSAFLQGLLLSDEPFGWECAHLSNSAPIRSWLSAQANATGFKDIAAFCLAFVRSQDWIDGVVVGLDSLKQLKQIITCFDQPVLAPQQLEALVQSRPTLPERSLDPSQWVFQERVTK